jgi:hypothetical protein
VNDRLEDSIEALQSILLAVRLKRGGVEQTAADTEIVKRAERCRLASARQDLQPILDSFVSAAAPGGR